MCPTSPAPILSGKDLFLPEALGEVLVGAVAENGDDHTVLQLPCDAQGGRNRGSCGDTHQDALLAGLFGGIASRVKKTADSYVNQKLDEIEARIDRKLDEIDRRLGEWRDKEIANRIRIMKITLWASVIVGAFSLPADGLFLVTGPGDPASPIAKLAALALPDTGHSPAVFVGLAVVYLVYTEGLSYGDVFLQAEQEYSRHNFEFADTAMLHRHFIDTSAPDVVRLVEALDGKLEGLTANSFSAVSLDPPLVLWSLRQNAPSLKPPRSPRQYSSSQPRSSAGAASTACSARRARQASIPVRQRARGLVECGLAFFPHVDVVVETRLEILPKISLLLLGVVSYGREVLGEGFRGVPGGLPAVAVANDAPEGRFALTESRERVDDCRAFHPPSFR